jgi:hypothetical protein
MIRSCQENNPTSVGNFQFIVITDQSCIYSPVPQIQFLYWSVLRTEVADIREGTYSITDG